MKDSLEQLPKMTAEDQQLETLFPKMTAEEIATYQRDKQEQMDQLLTAAATLSEEMVKIVLEHGIEGDAFTDTVIASECAQEYIRLYLRFILDLIPEQVVQSKELAPIAIMQVLTASIDLKATASSGQPKCKKFDRAGFLSELNKVFGGPDSRAPGLAFIDSALPESENQQIANPLPKMTAEEIAVYQKEKQGRMDQLIAAAASLSGKIVKAALELGANSNAVSEAVSDHGEEYGQLYLAFMTDLHPEQAVHAEEVVALGVMQAITASIDLEAVLSSGQPQFKQFDRIRFLSEMNRIFGAPNSRAPGLTFVDTVMLADADEQDQKKAQPEKLAIDKLYPIHPAPVPPVSQDQETSAAVSMRLWGGCMAVLGGLAVALALTVILGVPGAIVGTIGIAVALIGVGLFGNSFKLSVPQPEAAMTPASYTSS